MSQDSDQGGAQAPEGNVHFVWGVQIPLRDDLHLNATLYRPEGNTPTPAVFTLTPYTADTYHERAYYFAQHGYAFLVVDCRGRGNSEGEFEPFANEGRDAHDVVEWLATQPWCNGSVSMWGGSYAGFNQWTALKEFPPHLQTIAPAAAAHAAVDFPFFKNILYPYEMRWLTLTSGLTANFALFEEEAFWIEKFRELYLKQRPFKDLDKVVGNLSTLFRTWIQHPTPDAYWETMALTPDQYRRIEIPILTITGHYDGDQSGALHYYRLHMQHGTPAATAKHHLVVGPWDHAGTRTPKREFGGLKFAEASVVDLNELHREWYDWTLKDGSKPAFLKKRVAYYVMGAEEWKYADALEGNVTLRKRLYLNSRAGQANDVFHAGTLQDAPPEESLPDEYDYDPLDLRPAELEEKYVENYLTDQSYALRLYGNGLVYHTSPFPEAVEMTGFLRFVAWITLDVLDTDFVVAVSELLPDGSHVYLTRDLIRARYRESLTQERLVTPGEAHEYVFDGFTFFSRQVARGSRLRLLIRSPNSIFLEKNYNGGGVVAEESAEDAQTAHVTLHHDAEHPSHLELPLVEGDELVEPASDP